MLLAPREETGNRQKKKKVWGPSMFLLFAGLLARGLCVYRTDIITRLFTAFLSLHTNCVASYTHSNWAILLCDYIPDGKNWVNCAVVAGNSAGLRTVLPSRLSHRELRSSLTESHSFPILPADTTMASSQGTSVSSNSFSRWASHIFLFKCHFLLHILRFIFFFSDNIMADVASKRQPFIHHSRTHKKKHRTDKSDGKPVLCQRTFSSVFGAVFFLRS